MHIGSSYFKELKLYKGSILNQRQTSASEYHRQN